MIGWAKFVGFRFWISRFSRFRKGNFPLRFRYHVTANRDSANIFCWKSKIVFSPLPLPLHLQSFPFIYILSPLPQHISFTRIGSLFFVFALLRVSSFFIAIPAFPGIYSPLPIFEFVIYIWAFGMLVYTIWTQNIRIQRFVVVVVVVVFALLRLSSFWSTNYKILVDRDKFLVDEEIWILSS